MQSITLAPAEVATAGTHYNVHLINGLVLYIGTVVHPSAISLNGPAMDIYAHLVGGQGVRMVVAVGIYAHLVGGQGVRMVVAVVVAVLVAVAVAMAVGVRGESGWCG